MTGTAVERAARAESSIKDLVRQNWDAIKDSLPESMDGKRFARIIFNSVRKTPRLAEATATSLIGSLLAASTLGLEVDTPLGEAFLVPYRRKNRQTGQEWVEAQLIPGYQGIVKLYRQHPASGRVSSGWVGAKDEFAYAYGTEPYLKHTPAIGDRGEPIAFWASYTLKDGTTDFAVLSPAEVRALRNKGEDEKRDVADPQHWMERKTALKQALKLAPKSTRLAVALVVDEMPISQAARLSGMESVARVVQVEDVNLSSVSGEIEAGDVEDERIDEATGEVLSDAPSDAAEPVADAQVSAAAPIRAVTAKAIAAQFERCGIEASTVDAWLPTLGIPRTLAELSQDEAVELLDTMKTLDRDKLAAIAREFQGQQ